MVTMCSARDEFTRSTIAASVVDLPEPVTPVTSTSPRGMSQICSTTLGRNSSSSARIFVGNARLVSQRHQFAVNAQVRIVSHLQMQVRGSPFCGNPKQIINIHADFSPGNLLA